ncbi:MAG: hypothetical protein PHI24_09175 [Desulfitobacteriaceae bacterium]|nr:hypothetical protein [Desulfitobacteriaceae bacterium]
MSAYTPKTISDAPCTDNTLLSAASILTRGLENIGSLVIELNNKLFGPPDNMHNITEAPPSQIQGSVSLQDSINYSTACYARTYNRLVSILDRL